MLESSLDSSLFLHLGDPLINSYLIYHTRDGEKQINTNSKIHKDNYKNIKPILIKALQLLTSRYKIGYKNIMQIFNISSAGYCHWKCVKDVNITTKLPCSTSKDAEISLNSSF